jgi:hypothetical protein
MLRFEPPTLKEELNEAIRLWVDQLQLKPSVCFYEFDAVLEVLLQGADPSNYDDQIITFDTEIDLSLPKWDDSLILPVKDFFALTDELKNTKLIENQICRSNKRTLVYIEEVNDVAIRTLYHAIPDAENAAEEKIRTKLIELKKRLFFLDEALRSEKIDAPDLYRLKAEYNKKDKDANDLAKKLEKPTKRFFTQEISSNGVNILCSITQGFTIFGVMLASEKEYSKYSPPVGDYYLLEIRSEEKITEILERNIIEAYFFELSSSLNIEFKISSRIEDDGDWLYHGLDEYDFSPRFRPLLIGKGIVDLLELFNRAIASTDYDVQILYFTKVVEYVSQTVIKMHSNEAIRAKLLSPRALQPDASYIAELKKIVEAENNLARDKEAIKLTVATCCEVSELAKIAPPFLKKLKSLSENSNKKEALEKLSLSLYSTRNEVAHAKANYNPTGDECPKDQLASFAVCAKLVAQQVIRWYHLTPETIRLP